MTRPLPIRVYRSAAVSYKLVAEVLPCKPNRAAVRGSIELTVRQRLARAPAELCAAKSTAVFTCCCFGHGRVEVRVRLERDAVAAGETAHVVLEVRGSETWHHPMTRHDHSFSGRCSFRHMPRLGLRQELSVTLQQGGVTMDTPAP